MKKFLLVLVLCVISISLKSDGQLDTNFGGGKGYVATPPGFLASGVMVQQDGKIVVVGSDQNNNFQIVRYNSNGTLDTTFGQNSSGIGTGPVGMLLDVLVDSNGYIMAGGQAQDGNFQLARFYPEGFIDSGFGNNGVVLGSVGFCSALAQQDTNYFIAAGADNGGYFNENYFFVVRYDFYGNVDTYFDLGPRGYIEDLMLQADGKPVVCGVGGEDFNFVIARYTTEGSLDTTFGTHGVVNGPAGIATSLVIQPDGYIIIAGFDLSNPANMLLTRLDTSGNVDTTFGSEGVVSGPIGMINGMTLQSDGKLIVVGGYTDSKFIARFNVNGTLDTTFGTDGITVVPYGIFYSIASQADGNIIAVGLDHTFCNFLVSRYTNSQVLTQTQLTYPLTAATGSVIFNGIAQNPSTVYLFLDGRLVGSTTTNVAGSNTWIYTFDISSPGIHNIRVVSIYKPGNLVATGSQFVRIDG